MPAPDTQLLRAYLKHRDTPCPICKHNLRDFTANRCPECGHALTLTITTQRPLIALWLTAVLTTAIPAGFSITLAVTFAVIYIATDGDIPPSTTDTAAIIHALLAAAALTLLITKRNAFLTLTLQTRWLITAALATTSALTTTAIVLTFL